MVSTATTKIYRKLSATHMSIISNETRYFFKTNESAEELANDVSFDNKSMINGRDMNFIL